MRPPVATLDQTTADERHHGLAVLVHAGIADGDHAPAGPAAQTARLHHLGCIRDRVADIDRLEPLEIAKSGRRPELGHPFAPCPPLPVLAPAEADPHPHPNPGRVPTARPEPPKVPPPPPGLVHLASPP